MGRPSKLTPTQWADVERRLLEGETARSLGREYGISEAGIRKKFGANSAISAQSSHVRTVAEKVAEAELALQELQPTQRTAALSMARAMTNVAEAAEYGADTGRRLHMLANKAARELDMGDVDCLKVVAATTRTANEAMQPAIQLLNARERLSPPDQPDPDAPPTHGVLLVPGLADSSAAWSANSRGAKA